MHYIHRTRSSLDRFGSGPIRELVVQQALKCPHCDACFQHPNLLQRHMTRNHKCPRQVQRRLDMLNDSQEGKAICKHCNKSFTNWTSFKFIVQAGICLSNHDAHHQDDVTGNSNPDDQAPDRMPPPNSLELGDRAYAIAQSGDYELAKEDQALCTYLTQHCVLCNKFMSTSRSYTYHMRHYHQAALQDAISLGLQRCRQYNAMTSPCQFCQTEFTRAHMCIVCTQLAVLAVQHTSEAKEHKCYICSFVADDRTALKRHLSNEHHFSVFDWKPSRDSLENHQTCAHCGNTYHSIEVLRKHIIYGHCHKFDPDREWTRCGDSDIHGHFVKGNLKAIFADADMRKRLTLTCQFCKDSYQMVKHLAKHIYVHHGELVQNADLLCQWLKDTYLPTYGCVCNPSVKKLQQTHMCLPFTQLAMMHSQRGDWIFLPIIYNEDVRDQMITHVPINAILHVCDCLQDRQFQQIFQDPLMRKALRTSCLCCGKTLTTGGPSVEHNLDFHLRAEHPEPKQAITTLIDMLQHFHANDSESKCEWCMMDIKNDACDGDLSSHLAECGVLRNLVTWLCTPLLPHGCREPRSTAGGARPDGGRLGLKKRASLEETKGKHTISALFQRQQLRRHYQSDSDDGLTLDQARKRSCSSTKSDQLHSLSAHGIGWDHFKHPEPIFGVEEEDRAARDWYEAGDGRDEIPPSTTSAAAYPHNDPGQSSEDQSVQKGRQIAAGKLEISTAIGGQKLAFSAVVPSNEVSGDQWQTALNTHGRHDPSSSQLGRTMQGGGDHSQIPLTSSTKQPGAGDPMEVGCGREMSRGVCLNQEAGSIQPLATGLSEDQTSLPPTKQAGGPTSTSPTTQEEKQMIMQLSLSLQTITLVNNNVECYINSAFWTVCWAHLLCTQQTITAWQELNAPFLQMLCISSSQKLDLKHHSQMIMGMNQWQQIRQAGQQDFSEFPQFLLGWMNTKMVYLGFERRYTTSDGLHTAEKGGKRSPITLVSDLWSQLPEPFSFTMVLENWMKQLGMHTALTMASPILCLQVCRYEGLELYDQRRFDFGNNIFHIDVFLNNAGMETAKVEYSLIAAVNYAGASMRGHYQSAVHVGDQWLLLNDNVAPQPHASIPNWFMTGISHVWLVRKDLLRELTVTRDVTEVHNAMQEVHALLNAP